MKQPVTGKYRESNVLRGSRSRGARQFPRQAGLAGLESAPVKAEVGTDLR